MYQNKHTRAAMHSDGKFVAQVVAEVGKQMVWHQMKDQLGGVERAACQ